MNSLSNSLAKFIPQGMFWSKRWHLVSGCVSVSEGCANCWMRREAGMRQFHPTKSVRDLHEGLLTENGQWNGVVRFNQHLLSVPLLARAPQVFAVWSDLFHDSVRDDEIDRAMAVVLACAVFTNRPHTFIAPTKRADRQRKYFSSRTPVELVRAWVRAGNDFVFCDDPDVTFEEYVVGQCYGPSDNQGVLLEDRGLWGYVDHLFPLPNLIGCVTVENQARAVQRLPEFVATPFRQKVVLAEPLLDSVDLTPWIQDIHGVLTGGESGHRARPSHPDWFRSLRDQCGQAGADFFFKGWGEWAGWAGCSPDVEDNPEQTKYRTMEWEDGRWKDVGYPLWCDAIDGNICPENCTSRVGKKRSGRLLDGVEHNALFGIGEENRQSS